MGRSLADPDFFLKVAEKKPKFMDYIKNIDTLDIENLAEKEDIKKSLRKIKLVPKSERHNINEYLLSLQVKSLTYTSNKNELYEVRQWTGPNWFLPIISERTEGRRIKQNITLEIEISNLDIILISNQGNNKIKFNSRIGHLNDLDWNYFISNTKSLGQFTYDQYLKIIDNILQQKYG